MEAETLKKIGAWINGGDTGMSSKFLCSIALGNAIGQVSYPHDPSDFGRCYRFLGLLTRQESDEVLIKAGRLSDKWASVVANWYQLTALYNEECRGEAWKAPKLYALMKEIGL